MAPIYQDPAAHVGREGIARLVRPIGPARGGLRKYAVNFLQDGPDTVVTRMVNLKDISGGPGGG
jgi:hypothetical protein